MFSERVGLSLGIMTGRLTYDVAIGAMDDRERRQAIRAGCGFPPCT